MRAVNIELEAAVHMTIHRQSVAALAVFGMAALALPRTLNAVGEATSQAGADRPVILAVGESTTAGYGVERELSYPSQLQQKLDERGYRYRVVNHGVSGSTTQAALTRLDRGLALKPAIVVIALGGNDAASHLPIGITRANLGKLISMFKRVGAEVFLTDRNRGGGQGSGSIFAELAREHDAVLMPPLTEGVAGHPDLLIEDGSHPNAAGYTIIVRNILAVIEPYLKKDDSAQIRP
jgi:acyl-CoA thioesterase-1